MAKNAKPVREARKTGRLRKVPSPAVVAGVAIAPGYSALAATMYATGDLSTPAVVMLGIGLPALAAAASATVKLLGRLPEIRREGSIRVIAVAAARPDSPLAPDAAADLVRTLTPGDAAR